MANVSYASGTYNFIIKDNSKRPIHNLSNLIYLMQDRISTVSYFTDFDEFEIEESTRIKNITNNLNPIQNFPELCKNLNITDEQFYVYSTPFTGNGRYEYLTNIESMINSLDFTKHINNEYSDLNRLLQTETFFKLLKDDKIIMDIQYTDYESLMGYLCDSEVVVVIDKNRENNYKIIDDTRLDITYDNLKERHLINYDYFEYFHRNHDEKLIEYLNGGLDDFVTELLKNKSINKPDFINIIIDYIQDAIIEEDPDKLYLSNTAVHIDDIKEILTDIANKIL